MRYSLGRHNHPHARAGPAAADQLRKAASELEAKPSQNPGTNDVNGVHRARVAVKRARAALRLVEHADPEAAALAHEHLRAISHSLATARNADAACELADWLLCNEAESHAEKKALRSLRELHCHRVSPAPAVLDQARRALQREAMELEELIARAASPVSLARGYRRSTTRAVRAMRAFQNRPSIRSLHRWRRRTKDHLYQCVLVQRLAGRRMHRRVRRLEHLAARLGILHDLEIISGRRNESLGPDPATVRFVMARARTHLFQQVNREGERLFDKSARLAVRRVRNRLGLIGSVQR